MIVRNPKPVLGRDPSLWHIGLPANAAVNKYRCGNRRLIHQKTESKQTIAKLNEIYPGCTSGLVGTTETVVQAFMSVLSDGETPMPLNNGSMRDLNIATTDDDRPLVGCVLSEGDRLYVDCSDGRACDYAGVSFAVIKND